MKNEYKTKKANLIKAAIAEAKDELARYETALATAETTDYSDCEDPEAAREKRIAFRIADIRDKLTELASLYQDLATTY